ncbi:cofilin [Lobosporangium transversale]|uniref:Cofilin n=1 Tax=Lobosporangium transversale TaxID=64571 RepID=A0A1Y2GU54_9FUNG|nr:putative actin-binding protein cofilin [Lobosporangium transversale]KAF9918098.1 cofilin [Lobosporangium transversale]ORZ21879.1 putative actin-binding protein cofilin [Lobosporangium transversale]|eukprot:XP_021883130.1 putative actin-binding protein cofilin [Lobosporangium transversale]
MSSSSGVRPNAECLSAFQELKIGKKYKYIIYKLTGDEITVADKAETATYDQFLEQLPQNDCLWAVYDFDYKTSEGGDRSKIIFFSWSPDNASVKPKMLYASSKDALRRSLNGIATEIQGTDYSEVAYETVLEKVTR